MIVCSVTVESLAPNEDPRTDCKDGKSVGATEDDDARALTLIRLLVDSALKELTVELEVAAMELDLGLLPGDRNAEAVGKETFSLTVVLVISVVNELVAKIAVNKLGLRVFGEG